MGRGRSTMRSRGLLSKLQGSFETNIVWGMHCSPSVALKGKWPWRKILGYES